MRPWEHFQVYFSVIGFRFATFVLVIIRPGDKA